MVRGCSNHTPISREREMVRLAAAARGQVEVRREPGVLHRRSGRAQGRSRPDDAQPTSLVGEDAQAIGQAALRPWRSGRLQLDLERLRRSGPEPCPTQGRPTRRRLRTLQVVRRAGCPIHGRPVLGRDAPERQRPSARGGSLGPEDGGPPEARRRRGLSPAGSGDAGDATSGPTRRTSPRRSCAGWTTFPLTLFLVPYAPLGEGSGGGGLLFGCMRQGLTRVHTHHAYTIVACSTNILYREPPWRCGAYLSRKKDYSDEPYHNNYSTTIESRRKCPSV